jgi:hypothetical protein
MTQERSRVRERPAPEQHCPQSNRPARHESGEISATAVYLHIAPTLIETAQWPTAGTPAWAALADDDPAKLAALLYAALESVLAQDIRQAAERQASHAVSAAADWGRIGKRIKDRASVYIPRRSAS